ncbi:MAG: hypothetical protein Q8O56_16055 [Solirubrobacteraceae bacterium]|nr:hypothetical protein [Solirubrobacteraceae bacterium]
MPRRTLVLGQVLIALGLVGYVASGFKSWTALIPSILGAVLAACGLLAMRNPKLGVHLALLVALLGLAGTSMNVLKLGELLQGDAERPLAVVVSTITFVLLAVYIGVGVRSFLAARR